MVKLRSWRAEEAGHLKTYTRRKSYWCDWPWRSCYTNHDKDGADKKKDLADGLTVRRRPGPARKRKRWTTSSSISSFCFQLRILHVNDAKTLSVSRGAGACGYKTMVNTLYVRWRAADGRGPREMKNRFRKKKRRQVIRKFGREVSVPSFFFLFLLIFLLLLLFLCFRIESAGHHLELGTGVNGGPFSWRQSYSEPRHSQLPTSCLPEIKTLAWQKKGAAASNIRSALIPIKEIRGTAQFLAKEPRPKYALRGDVDS